VIPRTAAGGRAARGGPGPRPRKRERGQSLVEFSILLPLFLLLLLGPIEAGFMYMHYMGLEYSTRAGARIGALLAAGNQNTLTWPTVCATVDAQIVASVERTLRDRGSLIVLGRVSTIRIFKAQANGSMDPTKVNTWAYTGLDSGPTVDGRRLSFTGPLSPAWNACTRVNGITPDALGVAISYSYKLSSPLDRMFGIFGSGAVPMTDQTVMVLNP
jgi:hypothetical protein